MAVTRGTAPSRTNREAMAEQLHEMKQVAYFGPSIGLTWNI